MSPSTTVAYLSVINYQFIPIFNTLKQILNSWKNVCFQFQETLPQEPLEPLLLTMQKLVVDTENLLQVYVNPLSNPDVDFTTKYQLLTELNQEKVLETFWNDVTTILLYFHNCVTTEINLTGKYVLINFSVQARTILAQIIYSLSVANTSMETLLNFNDSTALHPLFTTVSEFESTYNNFVYTYNKLPLLFQHLLLQNADGSYPYLYYTSPECQQMFLLTLELVHQIPSLESSFENVLIELLSQYIQH
jgi:hypothetical protein